MKEKEKNYGIWLLVFCILLLFGYNPAPSAALADTSVTEMNQRIDSKKNEIDTLEKKMMLYQEKIMETKKQASTLKNELSILDNEIEKTKIDLEITEKQIQKTTLEIQKIVLTLDEKEKQLVKQKKYLSDFIVTLHQTDQTSHVEIFLMNDSFSDFFDHYKYLQIIQDKIQMSLKDIKTIKEDLKIQKSTLEEKRKRELELREDLEIQKGEQLSFSHEKETLLRETRRSETKFQSYVEELKREQQLINNEIVSLEKKIRDELERKKKEERFSEFGPPRFMWPVKSKTITAFFHDPDYPYRHIFEHPAIDIRAAQGTPIKTAEAGYVGRARDGGKKGYSYIMILHSDGLTTVYGHVSAIHVKNEQYVVQGEVIGLTGGMPGTSGAGPLTTGPHLHFEVRKNGIPADPLKFLP